MAAIALAGPLLVTSSAFGATATAAASARAPMPGPQAGVKAKLRAYGNRCEKVGRRADARVKRSAFARCLDAMARLGSGRTSSPRVACRGISSKRVKGRTSANARCRAAGAKLLRDKRRSAPAAPGAGGGTDAPGGDAGDLEQPGDGVEPAPGDTGEEGEGGVGEQLLEAGEELLDPGQNV